MALLQAYAEIESDTRNYPRLSYALSGAEGLMEDKDGLVADIRSLWRTRGLKDTEERKDA